MKTFFRYTLISLLPLVAWADAETPAEYQKELFSAIDQNKDGRLTEREFVVIVLYDTFMSIADKKGVLKRDDYFKWVKQLPHIDGKKEYALMDPKGKGYLVFDDVMRNTIAIKELEKEFRKLDPKDKGFVTLKDLPNLEQSTPKP